MVSGRCGYRDSAPLEQGRWGIGFWNRTLKLSSFQAKPLCPAWARRPGSSGTQAFSIPHFDFGMPKSKCGAMGAGVRLPRLGSAGARPVGDRILESNVEIIVVPGKTRFAPTGRRLGSIATQAFSIPHFDFGMPRNRNAGPWGAGRCVATETRLRWSKAGGGIGFLESNVEIIVVPGKTRFCPSGAPSG